MSFRKINQDAFKKYINTMSSGCNSCGSKKYSMKQCKSSCDSGKCNSGCGDKANSETAQDDGCFCRGCGDFQPMTDPDSKNDGKCLCYGCEHPWG